MANPKIPKGYNGTYAKNSNGGDTLIMVTREVGANSKKGVSSMANNKPTQKSNSNAKPNPPAKNNNEFQPTFRRYADMNSGEQAAFRQGAKTSENKVKERLGFTKPKD